MQNSVDRQMKKGVGIANLVEEYLGLSRYYLKSSHPEKAAGCYELLLAHLKKVPEREIAYQLYPKALIARGNYVLSESYSFLSAAEQAKKIQVAITDYKKVMQIVPHTNLFFHVAKASLEAANKYLMNLLKKEETFVK